jgi:hypothetical protein
LARQTNANRDVSVASSQALTRAIVVDAARLCAANQDRNSQNLRIFLKSSAPAWAGPTGKEHVWGGAVRGGGLSGRLLTVRKFDEIASAFIRHADGSFTEFDANAAPSTSTVPTAINLAGSVAGYWYPPAECHMGLFANVTAPSPSSMSRTRTANSQARWQLTSRAQSLAIIRTRIELCAVSFAFTTSSKILLSPSKHEA